jgi:hypothetical protein
VCAVWGGGSFAVPPLLALTLPRLAVSTSSPYLLLGCCTRSRTRPPPWSPTRPVPLGSLLCSALFRSHRSFLVGCGRGNYARFLSGRSAPWVCRRSSPFVAVGSGWRRNDGPSQSFRDTRFLPLFARQNYVRFFGTPLSSVLCRFMGFSRRNWALCTGLLGVVGMKWV